MGNGKVGKLGAIRQTFLCSTQVLFHWVSIMILSTKADNIALTILCEFESRKTKWCKLKSRLQMKNHAWIFIVSK